jgi:hypothetical protein
MPPNGRRGCLYSIRLWSISKLPEREAKTMVGSYSGRRIYKRKTI